MGHLKKEEEEGPSIKYIVCVYIYIYRQYAIEAKCEGIIIK